MNGIFTDFDKRLGIIPRWTIVHTIQKQSVAEHCFNVERIATRIAVQWFGVAPRSENMLDISQWALHHDDLEAVTGDIQSPVKPLFDETAAERLYPEVPINHPPQWIKDIVKLADIMEWVVFALYEQSLGNKFLDDFVDHHCNHVVQFAQERFTTRDTIQVTSKVKDWVFLMRKHPPKLRDFGRRM